MTGAWRRWLTSRPIAHRGLHDGNKSVIENSLAAADAAIARKFAIECDVQRSRDGEVMVFHDNDLDRLTGLSGPVAARTGKALASTELRGGGRIPTLSQFLDRIGGRVALIVEIKSRFDGDMRLADRTARIVAGRNQQIALKSFDPDVMAHLRRNQRKLGIDTIPLGMVAEADYESSYWEKLPRTRRQALAQFLHWSETRPDFLSWHVDDLPHATPNLLRQGLDLPVMTWTVRTAKQRKLAMQWADQIVFEETKGLKIQ